MRHFVLKGVVALLLALLTLPASTSAQARRLIANLTPQDIEAAIAAGKKGKYDKGELRISRLGYAREIGRMTTPWTRVAAWAERLHKSYEEPKAADVPPELLAPEAHIILYAIHENLADETPNLASITTVLILPSKGNDEEKRAAMLRPLRTEPLSRMSQNVYGAQATGDGMLAVFPLDALSEDRDFRIVYDRRVSVMDSDQIGCTDCRADIKLRGLK